MDELTADNMREAFKRLGDFKRVQVNPDDLAGSEDEAGVEGIQSLAESVGVGTAARREFYLGIERHLDGVPTEYVPEAASFIGLVVGLTARQLAEERKG